MATYPEFKGVEYTLTAAADIAAHLRVKIDTNGNVAVAGATDLGIGTMGPAGAKSGKPCLVYLLGEPRNRVASNSVAIGAKLFAVADGKVHGTDPGSARVVGVALEAAAADGDVIRTLPCDYVS